MAVMKTLGGYDICDQAARDDIDGMLDKVYPVGSIYTSLNPTSPAELFGGEWTQITNKFLYATTGTSSFTTANVGGSNTHTLTQAQLPKVQVYSGYNVLYSSQNGGNFVGNGDWWGIFGGYLGNGASHNNMPAYQCVYAWYRSV